MRARITMTLLALVGIAVLAACSSTSTTSTGSGSGTTSAPATPRGTTPGTTAPAGLPGTSWVLTGFAGPGSTAVPAAPGSSAPLDFRAAGVLNGSTGCNQFSGTYTADGAKLAITLGPMTQMACAGPLLSAQETAVTQLLPKVASFTATATELTLLGADGATMLTYKAGLNGLEGTSWKVTGLNNGRGGVESSAATQALTATFGANGAFSGFGGCNQLSGTWATSGRNGLTVTGVAGTMMACEGDASTVEAQYIAALGQVATYELSGSTLTLRDKTGAAQVVAAEA